VESAGRSDYNIRKVGRDNISASPSTPKRLVWLAATVLYGAMPLTQGCLNHQFSYWPTERVAGTANNEIILRAADTDLLFMIDNSASTAWYHTLLIDNTNAFIQALSASTNGYRVGIVTSEVMPDLLGKDSGRLRMTPATAGALAASGCNIAPSTGSPPWLDRPDPNDANVDDERCRLVQDFESTVASLGESGSGLEAGLLATRLALDASDPTTAVTNVGFLRPDADLAVIYITDEDDASFADYSFACPAGCSYFPPRSCTAPPSSSSTCPAYIGRTQYVQEKDGNGIAPSDFIDFFAGLKGSSGVRKIRGALIGGGLRTGTGSTDFAPQGCFLDNSGNPSAACECWAQNPNDTFFCPYNAAYGDLCPAACTPACAPAQPYCNSGSPACSSSQGVGTCATPECKTMPAQRYHQTLMDLAQKRMTMNFPPGIYEDSICQASFSDTLLQIVLTVITQDCFDLQQAPLNSGDVRFNVRHTDPSGASTTTAVPRLATSGITDASADCQSCSDAACQGGAWQFSDSTTMQICLACGLKMQIGNQYDLEVMTEISGF